jgi:hypothetical protein
MMAGARKNRTTTYFKTTGCSTPNLGSLIVNWKSIQHKKHAFSVRYMAQAVPFLTFPRMWLVNLWFSLVSLQAKIRIVP